MVSYFTTVFELHKKPVALMVAYVSNYYLYHQIKTPTYIQYTNRITSEGLWYAKHGSKTETQTSHL